MNINLMKTEIEEACRTHDFNRTCQALAIAIPASKSLEGQPGYEDFQEAAMIATIWVKTIGAKVEIVGKFMTTMSKQSLENGIFDYHVGRMFIDAVDDLKTIMKWDSIDPNFYINVDYIYSTAKPYVEAMEEGEV